MNQTLAVIIGATAVLVVGLIALTMFNTSIGDFETNLESTGDRGCEFQRENADSPDELSEECQPEGNIDRTLLRNDESVLSAVTGS